MGLKYKRVVLKLSGEALAGNQKTGLDFNVINEICASIKMSMLGQKLALLSAAEISGVVVPPEIWIVPERTTSGCLQQP